MKKILMALVMGFFVIGINAQADPVVRSVRFEAQSEAEMNAIPSNKLQEGSVCYREDTDSLWRYNGVAWAEMSGSGISDGDKGDITVSGATWNIDAGVVGSTEITDGDIDETDLDTSVNASLDLADSSVQPADLGGYLPLSGGLANEMTGDLHMGDNFIAGLNKVNWDPQSPDPIGVRNMWYNGTTDRFTVRDENNNVEQLAYVSELGAGSSFPVDADQAIIQDQTDNTKQIDWDLSGLTTGEKHTITMPDAPVNFGALTTDNLATGSVTGSDILNGTIQGVDVQDGSLTSADYAINSVTNMIIANAAVTPAKLSNNDFGNFSVVGGVATIDNGVIDEPKLDVTNSPTDNYVLTYNAAGTDFTWVDPSTIGGGTDDQNLSLGGTGNKDLTIEGGNTIDLTGVDGIDPFNIVSDTTGLSNSALKPLGGNLVFWDYSVSTTEPTVGAGVDMLQINGPVAEVVTSATIAMDGWKMYDDQTTDAATITLSDCDPGETLTVYINRASAPTLAGAGLTYNALPNTTAFAAATEMMIIFEVAYDGTTIDYYYVER